MWSKLSFAVATVFVSIVLAFAPVFAQEAVGPDGDGRGTADTSDVREGPELGWLGLIGLVGLAGLMRRDHTDRDHVERTTHRS